MTKETQMLVCKLGLNLHNFAHMTQASSLAYIRSKLRDWSWCGSPTTSAKELQTPNNFTAWIQNPVGLYITSQALWWCLLMSYNTIRSGQEDIQATLKPTQKIPLPIYFCPHGRVPNIEQTGARGMRGVRRCAGDNGQSFHAALIHLFITLSGEGSWAGRCRQSRDNDLILPTMVLCVGRAEVAFQMHSKGRNL